MSEKNRTVVELQFSDGSVIRAFESLSLRESFTDPLGAFDFVVRPPRQLIQSYYDKLQKGELVGLKVNGAPQASMLIETISTNIDESGVTFKLSCKTVLCTVCEASANPDYSFSSQSDTPISGVVLDLMRPFGFEEVFINADDDVDVKLGAKVDGKTKRNRKTNDLKHTELCVHEGETPYDVVKRIVTRQGLVLRVDVGGRLLLSSPNYDQPSSYRLVQSFSAGGGNRMLSGIEIVDTNSGQFSEVVVRGQQPSTKKGQTKNARPSAKVGVSGSFSPSGAPFANVTLTSIDDGPHRYKSATAAPYKPKFALDKFSRDNTKALNAAKLIMGKTAKDAFVVDCEVDGFVSVEGRVWTVDTVARVRIDAIGLDLDMWITERTLIEDGNGQRCHMKLIPLNSLVIGDVPGES